MKEGPVLPADLQSIFSCLTTRMTAPLSETIPLVVTTKTLDEEF